MESLTHCNGKLTPSGVSTGDREKSRKEMLIKDNFEFWKTNRDHFTLHHSSYNAKTIKKESHFIVNFGTADYVRTYHIITCPIFDGLFGF